MPPSSRPCSPSNVTRHRANSRPAGRRPLSALSTSSASASFVLRSGTCTVARTAGGSSLATFSTSPSNASRMRLRTASASLAAGARAGVRGGGGRAAAAGAAAAATAARRLLRLRRLLLRLQAIEKRAARPHHVAPPRLLIHLLRRLVVSRRGRTRARARALRAAGLPHGGGGVVPLAGVLLVVAVEVDRRCRRAVAVEVDDHRALAAAV